MANNICKNCGGKLIMLPNRTEAECDHCGNVIELGGERAKFSNLYSKGDDAWSRKDFDEAIKSYQEIADADHMQHEAHWGIALCRYGIAYEIDPVTQKKMPTCNRINRESILNDKDYLAAVKYADASNKENYEQRAKEIDDISKDFLKIVDKEKPYDVFISYKRTDANGGRTVDSQIAKKLYLFLREKGFNVFFAEESLKMVGGERYEPYIFAALTSANVMILFGSCKEYFEATWVKNEWRRFLVLSQSHHKKVLIPAYINCDPYKALPQELLSIQSFDATSPVFNEEIAEVIKKKSGEHESQPKAGKTLEERYAPKEKVDNVVNVTDCERDLAVEVLKQMHGNINETIDFIRNDPEYKKKLWVCAECGAQNTHDHCHNPECGLSKKESIDVARKREEYKRRLEMESAEGKRQRAIKRKKRAKTIIILIVVLAIVGGLATLIIPKVLDAVENAKQEEYLNQEVEDKYTPEILQTYSGTYSTGKVTGDAVVTIESCSNDGKLEGYFEFVVGNIYGKYLLSGEITSKRVSGKVMANLNAGEWVIHPSDYVALGTMDITFADDYDTLICTAYNMNLTAGSNDKYSIKTADDLQKLSESDGFYMLTADIDLSGQEWTPIQFGGTLIGKGHSIKNLTINSSSSNVGFFSVLSGTVSNLKFENANVTVTGRNENIGILAGKLTGTAVDITTSGSVTADKNSTYVGGVVGYVERVGSYTLSGLTNTANVSGGSYVGGIFGGIVHPGQTSSLATSLNGLKNSGNINSTGEYAGGLLGYGSFKKYYSNETNIVYITSSENTGKVTGTNYTGGLVGYLYSNNGDSYIQDSSNKSEIKGTAYVGCIAGKVENIQINSCTNEGSTLTATGYVTDSGIKYAYVGGYAGYGYGFSDCKNTVAINYTAGGRYVGGICGYINAGGCSLSSLENSANVTGNDYTGGVIGWINMVGNGTMQDIKNAATVSGGSYVGGIFGGIVHSGQTSFLATSLNGLKNSGNINSTGEYAGGLLGYGSFKKYYSNETNIVYITSSENTGKVAGTNYTGGLVGYLYSDSTASAIIDSSSTYTPLAGKLENVTIK